MDTPVVLWLPLEKLVYFHMPSYLEPVKLSQEAETILDFQSPNLWAE